MKQYTLTYKHRDYQGRGDEGMIYSDIQSRKAFVRHIKNGRVAHRTEYTQAQFLYYFSLELCPLSPFCLLGLTRGGTL